MDMIDPPVMPDPNPFWRCGWLRFRRDGHGLQLREQSLEVCELFPQHVAILAPARMMDLVQQLLSLLIEHLVQQDGLLFTEVDFHGGTSAGEAWWTPPLPGG
jgi:hypothetical protein